VRAADNEFDGYQLRSRGTSILKPRHFDPLTNFKVQFTVANTPMHSLPVQPLQPGLVNFPGATPASAALVAELLHRDFVGHHCFYNDRHFTNHLSHQCVSVCLQPPFIA
jgi:hypothetical protein